MVAGNWSISIVGGPFSGFTGMAPVTLPVTAEGMDPSPVTYKTRTHPGLAGLLPELIPWYFPLASYWFMTAKPVPEPITVIIPGAVVAVCSANAFDDCPRYFTST